MENRYYLSNEYAKLGHSGYDVERADFLSIGYYLTKDMVGNNGQTFEPGLMLRAYLTCDLWDWPVYVYGDVTYISEQSLQPKLLLIDVGIAGRPFRLWEKCKDWGNWEIRLWSGEHRRLAGARCSKLMVRIDWNYLLTWQNSACPFLS